MTSPNMIERIARTLGAQQGRPENWQNFVLEARELVAAMRSPTADMSRAGSGVPVGCCMTNASDAGEIWEYMIDAAMAEIVPVS